ncbi:MAG: acyltransferase [Vulcanimicrobiota bacterium]
MERLPDPAPKYVAAFDGLRLVLLLAVLEFHYCVHSVPIRFIWFLSYALPCFFVLSGFLITRLLLQDGNLKHFYFRRALRIFPAYYAVVLTAWAVYHIPYLGWHLTYLFNLKLFAASAAPPTAEVAAFMAHWDTNGLHLWSMGVEEQFYLLYPLFFLACPAAWRSLLLALGLAGSITFRFWISARFPQADYGALLPVAGEYILWGCLAAQLDRRPRAWLRSRWLGPLSLLGLLLLMLSETGLERYWLGQMTPPPRQSLYALCLTGFILWLAHHPLGWLSWKPLTRLGKISYGTYLVHPFLNPLVDSILQICPWLAPSASAPRALLGPCLSLLVAGLLWVSFEGRLNRWRLKTPSGSPQG